MWLSLVARKEFAQSNNELIKEFNNQARNLMPIYTNNFFWGFFWHSFNENSHSCMFTQSKFNDKKVSNEWKIYHALVMQFFILHSRFVKVLTQVYT